MGKMEYNLDQIDYQILRIMQDNARTNNADIARELGMAPSAILERVKKIRAKRGYPAIQCKNKPKCARSKMLSFIFIKAQDIIGVQKVGFFTGRNPRSSRSS